MKRSSHLISSGLWFDSDASEAVQFYRTVFQDVEVRQVTCYGKEGFEIHKRPEGSVMAISFRVCGAEFQAINGGPVFRINPSISYFITCENEAEFDKLWGMLIEGGKELMPVGSYDWSPRYGWLQDKYGLSWQLYIGEGGVKQKICPFIMFSGKQHGRAEEAIRFYTSIFKNSEIEGILKYPPGGKEPENTVMHGQFTLSGQTFMAMDSAEKHDFEFDEGVSFIVNCSTQEEIDYYWEKLMAGGGHEVECGWLEDKFGISWQVVPVQLDDMLSSPDKEKTERVTRAYLHMKKFDIHALKEAFDGE